MPGLLNYTTDVAAERSATQIQERLRAYGAQAILFEYDGAKALCGLSFKVETSHGVMPIRLPANVGKVEALLRAQYQRGQVPKACLRDGQPRRIAWRILKVWVDAQLALIQIDMVSLDQVFLPYTVVDRGKTVYDVLVGDGGFQRLLLPPKEDAGEHPG